jgi:hypothetical protein
MPSSLLSDLMAVAEQEDKAGLCISSDELEKDIAMVIQTLRRKHPFTF